MILACLEQCVTADLNDNCQISIQSRRVLSLEKDGGTGQYDNISLLMQLPRHITNEKIEIFTLPNTASPWPDIGTATERSLDTSSKKSLEQARSWLVDCCKNHPQCDSPTDHHHPLPTRLIDVMDGQKGGPVRLIETSIGQQGRYICLSHCWGDPECHPRPIETNHSSLKRYKEQIPWRSLPKTFQDAVSFVRLLGESYIWIDSLCIAQDCPDDWRQEASRMADVYSNSYLTLAATKSTNSTESLFSTPEDTYNSHPYEIKENGSTFTVHYRKSLSHFFGPWDGGLEPPPLLKRAWVYQERLLSPRTLHFGNQELVWECRESTTCQCGVWYHKDDGQTCPKLNILPRNGGKSRLWYRVVEDYSPLQLTKESDRLPAIAGIAKRIQCFRSGEDYLAGLWKKSLPEDLLWKRSWSLPLDDPASRKRDTSAAPSWSWVCIQGAGVRFVPKSSRRRVAYLVDAKVQSDQHDVFMNASSGSVTMESLLFTARLPGDHSTVFVLEPPLPGATIHSNKFVSSHTKFFESLKLENADDGYIRLSSLTYFPDEGSNLEDKLPEDPSIRYLLTHLEWSLESYLLALRPKVDQRVFERVGLLRVNINFENFHWCHLIFRRHQMRTVTIV